MYFSLSVSNGAENLHHKKAQPVREEGSVSTIPCGFAFISCKLIYWQSRASGELSRAGADPVVTCRVFPLRLSKSVLFISSENEMRWVRPLQRSRGPALTPLADNESFLTTDSTVEVFPSLQFLAQERAFLHFEKWNFCRNILVF